MFGTLTQYQVVSFLFLLVLFAEYLSHPEPRSLGPKPPVAIELPDAKSPLS